MKTKIFGILFIAIFLVGTAYGVQEARVLRFPSVHQDRIVFCYAGDLYTVGVDGGVARKLTSHEGYEAFPRFSPDGKWIAFTGEYDGKISRNHYGNT